MKKTALITGASGGIGYELALLAANDGFDLIITGRNRDSLNRLKSEINHLYPQNQVLVCVQDLAAPGAVPELVSEIEKAGMQVNILVNNAGTQAYAEFVETEEQTQLDLLQVNITALTQLTHRLLPGMLVQGWGRILNLASTASFSPSPLNITYCASKAYVHSFSVGLSAELADTPIKVTSFHPGATDTGFKTRHNLQDTLYFKGAMDPKKVAAIGYRAMLKGRTRVVAGLRNKLEILMYMSLAPFLGIMPTKLYKRIAFFLFG